MEVVADPIAPAVQRVPNLVLCRLRFRYVFPLLILDSTLIGVACRAHERLAWMTFLIAMAVGVTALRVLGMAHVEGFDDNWHAVGRGVHNPVDLQQLESRSTITLDGTRWHVWRRPSQATVPRTRG